MNERWNPVFRSPFQWFVSQIEYSRPWKTLRNLCSPNEDFGRPNKRWSPYFRLTFQWFVAQIEYSRPWKVLRKSGFHLLFLLPKSSFGRDKIPHFIFCSSFPNLRLGVINVLYKSQDDDRAWRSISQDDSIWRCVCRSSSQIMWLAPKASSWYHHLAMAKCSSCYHHLAIATCTSWYHKWDVD